MCFDNHTEEGMGGGRAASPISYKAQPGLALRHRSGAKRRPRCGGWMTVQRGRKDHHTTRARSGPPLHGTSSTTLTNRAGAKRQSEAKAKAAPRDVQQLGGAAYSEEDRTRSL